MLRKRKKKRKLNFPSELKDVFPQKRMRLCKKFFSLSTNLHGCKLWDGHLDRKGYGQVWLGRAHWAHRVYYAMFVGPIPEGKTVHHRCGFCQCVNPEHLELLDVSENTAEGNKRRRKRKDERLESIPF